MIEELLSNKPLIAAAISWLVAQILKVFTELIQSKKLNYKMLISSGGMPSSHSAFVSSLALSIGIHEGFDTGLFATSVVLAAIVMYDAAGVRRAAGQHAAVINTLLSEIGTHGIKLDKQLKELLGHTPFQVFAGAFLGILIAMLI